MLRGDMYNDRVSIQEKRMNSKRKAGDSVNSGWRSFLSNGDTFIAFLLVLVAVISFGLGQLSEKTTNATVLPLSSTESVQAAVGTVKILAPEEQKVAEQYVASKSGKKYHLPWCSGAANIKESNKIWFDSKAAAEAAGYTPAANCKGM